MTISIGERKFEYGYAGNGIKCKCSCEAPSYLTGEQAISCGNNLAKAQAVPEDNKELLQSLHDMVEIVGANFCSNQDVKRKYKIARELLEQNK